MMEEVELMTLTLRRSSMCMRPWHQAVSLEREPQSSVWHYWKPLDGMWLTIAMLSHSSMVKAKDVTSSMDNVAAADQSSRSSAQEAADHVLSWDTLVDHATLTLRLMDANISTQVIAIIVRAQVLLEMLRSQVLKYMEEELEVDASLEVCHLQVLLLIASSTTVWKSLDPLSFKFYLERLLLLALKKDQCQYQDTLERSTVLIQ